jgi:hypothetical protein
MVLGSDRRFAAFAVADADHLFNRRNVDLSVAHLAGACAKDDGFEDYLASVCPLCLPNPRTSATVIPSTPASMRHFFTSSSLLDLIIALIRFTQNPPSRFRDSSLKPLKGVRLSG